MKSPTLLLLICTFLLCCKKGDDVVSASGNAVDTTGVKPVNTNQPAMATTFDLDPSEAPRFVKANYVELDSIYEVSLFRSGIGHDYSDDFEFCRSMKHYFKPKAGLWSSIKIYSPIDGTVVKIFSEWAGNQVHIKSKDFPAFTVKIFHVNVKIDLKEGDKVVAGQQLGTHIGNQTMSDIAVAASTSLDGPKDNTNSEKGLRLISYFQVMSDSLFNSYQMFGITSRNQLMIDKAHRDAQPLTCNGESFNDVGTLSNWLRL